MLKKLTLLIISAVVIPFNLSCYENSQEATITVDFGSVDALEQATGISGISKASSIIPYTVSTIEIKVYSGDEVKGVVYRKIFYRRDFAADRVTINVPAGSRRIVKVTARHMDGTVLYTGTSLSPIDLVSGVNVTVPVTMEYELTAPPTVPDANFTLNIQDLDSSSYTAPTFVSSIVVRIYRPSVSYTETSPGGYLELGKRDTDNSYSSATTNIPNLEAYPYTYQMVIAMAIAPDGTIAAIGGTVISTLASGTNTKPVTVTMTPPAPIYLTNGGAGVGNSIVVQMDLGEGYVTVNPLNYYTYNYGTYAYLYVPNRLNNVREWENNADHDPIQPYDTVAKNFRISLDGGFTYKSVSLAANGDFLRWKQTIIDYSTWVDTTTIGWTLSQ